MRKRDIRLLEAAKAIHNAIINPDQMSATVLDELEAAIQANDPTWTPSLKRE